MDKPGRPASLRVEARFDKNGEYFNAEYSGFGSQWTSPRPSRSGPGLPAAIAGRNP